MAIRSKQDFLDLADRWLPSEYLDPLKDPGPGFEVIQAYAAVFNRSSIAIDAFCRAGFILLADGGAKSTVTVAFSRPTAAAGAVTIKAGTVITTSRTSRPFVTTLDLVFGGAVLGPLNVAAQALISAYEWNVTGPVTAADGTLLLGEIDTILTMRQDPVFTDQTFSVAQVDDATGGSSPALQLLGEDRGLPQRFGETNDAYRDRIRQLPDTVSPDAIKRAVSLILDPLGLVFDFIETFESRYQTAYDVDASIPVIDTNLFAYDSETVVGFEDMPFRNRWLDDKEHRAAFIIVVPRIGAVRDAGMAYDDTATTPANHITPSLTSIGGKRAHSAYDVPSTATSDILQGAYDGDDLSRNALYKAIFDMLQRIKPGGHSAILEIDDDNPLGP